MKYGSIIAVIGLQIVFVFLLGIFSASSSSADFADNNLKSYAVVFPMNTSSEDSFVKIIKANGKPVRHGYFENIIIATSNNDNFKENLQNEGAILTFSPFIFGGCNVQDSRILK